MRFFAALLCAVCVAACTDSPDAPTGPVNVQLVLAPGETADVSNTTIQVRFQGVAGDSRCPGDATCITAGDAIVSVDVLPKSGSPRTIELHTGNMQPVRDGDLTIALENLTPYPFNTRPIQPGDYRATLRITR